ncbi:MAG: hypothetical protein RJB01_1741, partial [Actinomycetota bacterium]
HARRKQAAARSVTTAEEGEAGAEVVEVKSVISTRVESTERIQPRRQTRSRRKGK